MNPHKLDKLRQELDAMRHRSVTAADIQRLAGRLGRTLANRGKEPNWINTEFPGLRPLSIPDHGGRDLSPGVRKSVLNELENDIDAWEQKNTEDESKKVARHDHANAKLKKIRRRHDKGR
jgi:hypothetical protein